MKYKFIHFIELITAKTIMIIDSDESDKDQTFEKKFVDFEKNKTNVSF